jgi:hypothetical protein
MASAPGLTVRTCPLECAPCGRSRRSARPGRRRAWCAPGAPAAMTPSATAGRYQVSGRNRRLVAETRQPGQAAARTHTSTAGRARTAASDRPDTAPHHRAPCRAREPGLSAATNPRADALTTSGEAPSPQDRELAARPTCRGVDHVPSPAERVRKLKSRGRNAQGPPQVGPRGEPVRRLVQPELSSFRRDRIISVFMAARLPSAIRLAANESRARR